MYVDAILVINSQKNAIVEVKHTLHDLFKFKDLGETKYFLGMKITRDASGIQLTQRKYTLDLLKDTGFIMSKPTATAMETTIKFEQ